LCINELVGLENGPEVESKFLVYMGYTEGEIRADPMFDDEPDDDFVLNGGHVDTSFAYGDDGCDDQTGIDDRFDLMHL
jgi:hypothetical protein